MHRLVCWVEIVRKRRYIWSYDCTNLVPRNSLRWAKWLECCGSDSEVWPALWDGVEKNQIKMVTSEYSKNDLL